MAASAASALPGSLDHVADALALPVRKDEDGQQIMLEMCRPRQRLPGEDPNIPHWHEDPARLVRLGEYCKRDVEVERLIAQRVPPLSDNEQALWILDQQINRRGFAVDIPLATAARELSRATLIEINHELDTLTGGRVTSVSQVARIIALVQERGHKIENLGKRNVSAVLAAGPSEKIARLLTLRQEGSRASANKLETLLASANDGRLHGALRFHGAATGRWSGHGFQPHNLSREQPDDPNAAIAAVLSGDIERVRTIGSPLDVIGSLSRALICAAPGHTLIGADYSGIEARVTAWFAGEQWKLDTFRRFDATGDPTIEPYCVAASRIFGHPITPEDEEARHIGKMCELAFGFGGGLGAFRRIAPDADFTDEEVETFKRQWRSAHPNIVRFWGSLHRTLLRAVRTRTPMTLRNISTEMRDGNLYLKLPSGREIVYPQARIEPGAYDSDRIVFKDSALGKWRDVERSWHGLFVENVVQATARDLLAAAMPRLEAAGYTIVLHVHDEIVCEVPEDFGEVAEFTRLMTELPAWAEGLPLVAKTSRRQRYAKAEASTETIEESLSLEGANDDAPDECPAECTPEAAAMPDTTDDSAPEPLPVAPAEINEIKRERIDTIEIAPPALAAAITSMSRVGGIANDGIYREPPRRSSGSRVDGFSEKHAGKAYTDAHLRARGYQFARAFPFELPDGTKLYEERRYELRAGVTPTEELERKTCRFCHVDAGVTRFDTGPRRIIYNWPAIMRAGPGATVHITEGASKSAPLNAAGLLATAVAYHKWEPECVAALAGLHLIYHEDHDDNGRTYSADARKHLAPIAASFRIVPAAHVQSDRARAVADRRREGLARSRRRSGKANRHLPGNSRGPKFEVRDIGNLKHKPAPRGWLLGLAFCRKFLSQLFADGAVGKTALRYAQYLALASGRSITSERVFVRCRVLILSFEDSIDELERRLWAAMLHYGIEPAEVAGWLFYAALSRDAGKIMVMDEKGRVVEGELKVTLEQLITELKLDLVGLDPFVKTHSVSENSNDAIDAVAQVLTDLGHKYDIAVDVPHHITKGTADPGNAQKGRGASAFVDAGRLAYTLTPMTEDEAKLFGILPEERRSYIRLDKGKVNITPPARTAAWFRLVGVALGNATETYPHGDNVQTVEPWVPPEIWDGFSVELRNIILDEIDAGMPNGQRYSDHASAKDRAATAVVTKHVPDKNEAQAREVIKEWIKTRVLERRAYDDPERREPRNGLFVNADKRPK